MDRNQSQEIIAGQRLPLLSPANQYFRLRFETITNFCERKRPVIPAFV
jgi:hypothetical protein